MRIFSRTLELQKLYTVAVFCETLLQMEKERNSFCAKLDVEIKFLSINDTYSLKNVFKHKDQQQILHQYGVEYEISSGGKITAQT